MKKSILSKALLLLTSILVSILGACVPSLPTIDTPDDGIVQYDISIEMDPSQGIFRSQQQITITGRLAEGQKLSIFIGNTLVIDTLTLEDDAGNSLPVTHWQQVRSFTTDYFWGKRVTSEIEIRTAEKIPPEGLLKVNLDGFDGRLVG